MWPGGASPTRSRREPRRVARHLAVGRTSRLPGRAPWGAGAAGQRALSQAAANELKPHGVHAALLVCDGSFGGPGDDAGGERIDTRELANAVQFLHEQGRSAWTHELDLRPWLESW